jgi:hypothetical protein
LNKNKVELNLKTKIQTPTKLDVLEAISDEKSLYLLDSIAKMNTYNLYGYAMKIMTHKQYYLRITRFLNVNLIKRAKGSYKLTHFGMVIYEAHLRLGVALKNRWKLMALDNLYNLYSSNPVIINRRSDIMNLIITNL